MEKLTLITIEEFAELAHIGIEKAREIYNMPDFPSCDYGRQKFAEVHAVEKYFSIPRRRNNL